MSGEARGSGGGFFLDEEERGQVSLFNNIRWYSPPQKIAMGEITPPRRFSQFYGENSFLATDRSKTAGIAERDSI